MLSSLRLFLFVFLVCANFPSLAFEPQKAAKCSKRCLARNCESFNINYGKYCGVGYTGCSGEPPCDAYDACCKVHDACVGDSGVSASDLVCHDVFKKCLATAKEAGEPPFSDTCDLDVVVKTMSTGMDLAAAFAGMLKPKRGGGVDVEL